MNQVSTTRNNELPKTARGRRTREKLLRAAEIEFGERGFHAASISGITRSADVALGSFYTYFESKEEIFRALVMYMSRRTRRWIAKRVTDTEDRLTAERKGLEAYIEFVREHKGIYRIISEAEFVANAEFREHYESFALAYQGNLSKAGERGDIRDGDYEAWSWAIMGMAVSLGMRYAQWDEDVSVKQIAETVADMVANGIRPRKD